MQIMSKFAIAIQFLGYVAYAAPTEPSAPPTLLKLGENGEVLEKLSPINVTDVGDLFPRSGSIRAYKWVSDCSGSSDWTWQNVGAGCYSFNGNTDMYSIYVNNLGLPGCADDFHYPQIYYNFHDFGCNRGWATKESTSNGCMHDSKPIKSFEIFCEHP
ncbi:hypothetical protein B0J11DRAFT_505290 [Dendryphion nanum]|uniref:Uncharacterized protein n=1 Tax=Dendryphion nanum TaxID=256645 RepID=A0A9P9DYJ9_9PLEO|nr:hypothetical protein B0J11DRAFT_505290 [Dendryphion nanum]